MRPTQLGKILLAPFTPPFKGLWLVVWCYFIICFLLNPKSPILDGKLPDTDDYIYLAQAIDWLKGQGWYDFFQHRMNPPEGTYIHFSHLLSALYAAPIFLLSPWLGYSAAAILMAALFQPLLFIVFLFLARWAALPLIGREWSGMTSYIALSAIYPLILFSPGHIDHHGLEITLALLMLGVCSKMICNPLSVLPAMMGGIIMSTGLVIGLEFLPVLLVVTAWLGLWSIVEGKVAARSGLFFSLSLCVGSFAFLLLSREPSELLKNETFSYSIVYVVLNAGAVLCFMGVFLASYAPRPIVRYAVGVFLSVVLGGLFLHSFPLMMKGPLGGVDPELARLVLVDLGENPPIIRSDNPLFREIITLLWPTMGLVASGYFFIISSESKRRWLWGLQTLLLLTSVLLAAFYQNRVLAYAETFCIIPLAAAFHLGWMKIGESYRNPESYSYRYSYRLFLLFLIGPLPMVLIPAFMDGRPFNTGVVLYPNPSTPSPCDIQMLSKILDTPSLYGDRPRIIMNTINEGAELIFRTTHYVLAAPYHTNVSGNLDSERFFTTHNADEAEAIARRRGAELVVMCKDISDMYKDTSEQKILFGENGIRQHNEQTFAEQLIDKKVPPWLKPISFPLLGNMMLFEIKKK